MRATARDGTLGPTVQIARALAISEWTVQDHRTSVFAKFDVNSRAELMATLFFDHDAPRHDAEDAPSPYGWYLDPSHGSVTGDAARPR